VIEMNEAVGIGNRQGLLAGMADDLLSIAAVLDAVRSAGDEKRGDEANGNKSAHAY